MAFRTRDLLRSPKESKGIVIEDALFDFDSVALKREMDGSDAGMMCGLRQNVIPFERHADVIGKANLQLEFFNTAGRAHKNSCCSSRLSRCEGLRSELARKYKSPTERIVPKGDVRIARLWSISVTTSKTHCDTSDVNAVLFGRTS